jgi:hypothetical protein
MTRHARLLIGALAALYLLWLATWIVFDNALYSPLRNYWDQTAVACVTAVAAFYTAHGTGRPYRGFLAMQGFAFLLMALAWLTYRASIDPSANTVSSLPDTSVEPLLTVSDAIYALSVFALLCAWSYLTVERWHERPLSWLTTTVFAVLMVGLGMIFASFYYSEYADRVNTPPGRLSAVTAALEFATLAVSLLCMLLRLPSPAVWMLVGTVILLAGDMAFSVQAVPPIIETAWMFGQVLVLSSLVLMVQAQARDAESAYELPRQELSDLHQRSGISGILILVSLGAVLLSPLVWFLPVSTVWKSFCSALFIVWLVVVLVWITDRFDDTVSYLRSYVRRVHESRLVSEDWRGAPARTRAALSSTGLGTVLDTFRDSGARLKQDVLFLGPERLFGPPKDRTSPRNASCFIVMPFGQEWSGDVHRILARACETVNVRAVRGDDLFTPTDFLEDIWQGINAADFVIADISGRNPNVLYELGIAHTLAKPVLILSKQATDIPVDLATRRVILYGESEVGWREDLAQKISVAVVGIVRDYGLANRHE